MYMVENSLQPPENLEEALELYIFLRISIHIYIYILVKISKLPLDFVPEMLLRSIILDNNILNINYSILQTIIYTFFDKLNKGPVLIVIIRWDPCFSKSHRAILGRKMVNVLIGFYMIYRLYVIYSDKVLF